MQLMQSHLCLTNFAVLDETLYITHYRYFWVSHKIVYVHIFRLVVLIFVRYEQQK